MSESKKVLVIGGTGAIGRYTVPALLAKGYRVDVLALDTLPANDPNLRYIIGPGTNRRYVQSLLETERYDGIIDYMVYPTPQFAERFEMFLQNTAHYIYLSSYRVYDNSPVIREDSPRLLDSSRDSAFLESDDYALHKARGENILRASKYKNWTIVRPSITYSVKRYQLVTWEANVLIPRALAHKKIVLPQEAMEVESAMTWAGDSGRMFAQLLFHPQAMGETFTLSTAEHHPWAYVANCYTELLGAEFVLADRETFLKIKGCGKINPSDQWQLDYDRLFDRVVDNSKVLTVTGMKQAQFMPLQEGLRRELAAVDLSKVDWAYPKEIGDAMDRYLSQGAL